MMINKIILYTRYIVFGVMLIWMGSLSAQVNKVWEETVTENYIRSVQFRLNGLVFSQPVIELGSSAELLFTFDDLKDEDKDYSYDILHCNADWTESNLQVQEYLSGFGDADFEEFELSFNTITEYQHYVIVLPDEYINFTKSGNYVLRVYDVTNEKRLVIVRRFVVLEPYVSIEVSELKPAQTSKIRTHQEFDFKVAINQLPVKNGLRDLRACVLQNGRWDNAVMNLAPKFYNRGVANFDHQNKVIFDGGNEFRYFDIRSLDYAQNRVNKIRQSDEGYDVQLFYDKVRGNNYVSYPDLNGNYVVQNYDNGLDARVIQIDTFGLGDLGFSENGFVSIDNYFDSKLGVYATASDYARVHFRLESMEFLGKDLYVYGAFSNWKLSEENKLSYNNELNAYEGSYLFKQGYYNYKYLLIDSTGNFDESRVEGSFNLTENDYLIMIYFRSFGQRYDQVVGAYTFTSSQD